MNERRLIYVNILKNHYQLREVDDNNYCCRRLEHEEVNDLLNEQQDQITNMKKERKKLKEENERLMIENAKLKGAITTLELSMQVRRLTPRTTDKEVIEFNKELEDE